MANIQIEDDSSNSNNKKIIKRSEGLNIMNEDKGYLEYQDGIKRPVVYKEKEKNAIKKVKKAKLIFEKTLAIEREYPNSYHTTYINYRVYNKKAKKVEEKNKNNED